MSVIGIIKLAPGQVGFFDDLTRIHLTIASPERPVLSSMNTINLKRAVKSGRILLISGTLDATVANSDPVVTPEIEQKVETPAPVEPTVEEATPAPAEESGIVDINAEVPAAEETSEEAPTADETPVEEDVTEEDTSDEADAVEEESGEAPAKTAPKKAASKSKK